MARTKYLWQPGAPPPPIDPHSLAKHEVLAGYLRQYVRVVTANRRMDKLNLTLVDGFAGGGEYLSPGGGIHPGSPLIMLKSMEDATAELVQERSKPFHLDVSYVFVEKDPGAFRYLAGALDERGHGRRIGQDIRLIGGTWEQEVDAIAAQIRARGHAGRSIFVLDQYGYTGVLLATIRRIFKKLKKAEVLLTLATDWLVDFVADSPTSVKALAPLELEPGRLLAAKEDSRDWRRAIQHLMYEHIVRESGAAYYTPFFIVSPDAHRSFWLLHLSGHARARDEMAKLHWELHNHFEHYGGAGLKMLGYNPKYDSSLTRQLPFSFDNAARQATLAALAEDLPTKIWPFLDGVPFDHLFAEIANDTPAHSDIVKESILALARDGVFEVLGRGGGKVRQLDRLDDKAIVRPFRQTRLFQAP